jgi:PASTA domain
MHSRPGAGAAYAAVRFPGMLRLLAVAAAVSAVAMAQGVSAAAYRQTEAPAQWDVLETGAGGRSLIVVYTAGGCMGQATATVTETTTSVSLSVMQPVAVPEGHNEACPADLVVATVRVALLRSLGGRSILGRPAAVHVPIIGFGVPNEHGEIERKVPRLIGFSPTDAADALELAQLGERVRYKRLRSSLPRVISQRPAPGQTVGPGGAVRVVVSTG